MRTRTVRSYYLESVTTRVAFDVVTSIPVLHIWHYNKRFVIQYVRTKEF